MKPRHFFGDAERDFALSRDLILELERKAGAGIGTICKRLFGGFFGFDDVRETIRLGLIGGGAEPAEAAALVATYVDARPLSESLPIATAILEALWFGPGTETAA